MQGRQPALITTPPPQEASFSRTLLKGIERFKKAAAGAAGGVVSGADAFLLWDTYGFPLDLTQVCEIVSVFLELRRYFACTTLAITTRYSQHTPPSLPPSRLQLMAEEAGLVVDGAGFEAAMDEARERSRAAGKKAAVSRRPGLAARSSALLAASLNDYPSAHN